MRAPRPRTPPPRLAVDYADAGLIIGVSPGTIINLVASGDLQAFYVRSSPRIAVESIEQYIADRLADRRVIVDDSVTA